MSLSKISTTASNWIFNEPSPEYGYAANIGEGVGSLLMIGARIAKAKVLNSLNEKGLFSKVAGVIYGLAIGILSAPITLIGAAIRGISELVPHKFKPADDSIIKRTSPEIVDQVYSLLNELTKLAKARKLIFWANGGTLLGAARHKGMIPWDDDGDVVIHAEDLEKVLSMKEELKTLGIDLFKGPLGLWKIQYTPQKRKELFHTDLGADIDIELVEKNSKGFFAVTDPTCRDLYPQEYFLPEELKSLKEVPFGPRGLKIHVPNNPERYLTATYGKDCMKYGMHTHTHNGFFGLKLGNYEFNPVLTKQKVRIIGDYAIGNIWK